MEKQNIESPDWEKIEAEYRAGALSVREIGKRNGVSHTGINKRAKGKGWTRNLINKVRAAVATKLVAKSVATGNAREEVETGINEKRDDEIIDRASDEIVQVVELHREDIKALRRLELKLLAELGDKPKKLYMAQYQGDIVSKEVMLTVSERAAALRDLANVQHKRIVLERQAYNMVDKEDHGQKETVGEAINSMSSIERAARVVALVRIAKKRAAEAQKNGQTVRLG